MLRVPSRAFSSAVSASWTPLCRRQPGYRSLSSLNGRHEDRLLVVGSGVAGSAAALVAAEQYKIPVTILFAGQVPTDCNSYWAQGGIIYRNYNPNSGDSAASLAADIQRAGAGLCEESAVWKVAREGPDRVRMLLLSGDGKDKSMDTPYCQVPFERDPKNDSEYALCLEASHAAPRILFTADHTGRSITECLAEALQKHPLITLQHNTIVTDLIVSPYDNICLGVTTLNRATGEMGTELATHGTVLCSGGLAGIYQHSTNPSGFNALGSSVALATRAGAHTRDMEYVQFHPTALNIPNQPSFLLSEALRGEGAKLLNADGDYFASKYHEDAELAPRDVVARAVYAEARATGAVYLDLTESGHSAQYIRSRFPSIQAQLQKPHIQLDLATDKIPILPAAHYTCGGVVTDEHGATNVGNLYAAGEAARTGLHGGNRLASTSLLEGLVYGAAVADHLGGASDRAREWINLSMHIIEDEKRLQDLIEETRNVTHLQKREPQHAELASRSAISLLQKLRQCMWDNVGVVRTSPGLERAVSEMNSIRDEALELFNICPTPETAAVRDAAYAGLVVAEAASRNKVSVGSHFITDEDTEESESDEEEPAAL